MLGDILSKFGLTNILGTVTAVLAGFLGLMEALGCLPGATDFTATCNLPSWVPTGWVVIAAASTGVAAFVSKLLRPGTVLRNLFGGTAVIVPKSSPESGPNTVTPEQAASK